MQHPTHLFSLSGYFPMFFCRTLLMQLLKLRHYVCVYTSFLVAVSSGFVDIFGFAFVSLPLTATIFLFGVCQPVGWKP